MLDTILLQYAIAKAWEYQTLTLPNPSVGALLYSPRYGILSLQAHQKVGAPHAEVLAFAHAARKLYEIESKTTNDIIESKQSQGLDSGSICARSGVSGDLLLASDTQEQRSCVEMIESLDSLFALPLLEQSQALHTFLMQNARGLFEDCTLYVSLEPCTHFGKTPPCVELTKAMRPKRVVIGTTDPHTKASGGAEILKQSGIEVVCGICESEAQALLYPFVCYQERGSFRLFKLAMRLNGDYKSGQISQPATQVFTHNQRAVSDTIIVSGETFRTDMPRLDSRLATPPYDASHLPNIEILTRSTFAPSLNPHFASRPATLCHSPDSLSTHQGFCIIEGGFGLLATLREQIDMVLVHIAPNLYPHTSIPSSHDYAHKELYRLSLLHTTSHTGDISLWFKNP
ncbi:bifunctional diaminohydroxyphosphoribosylaminopyrimidine deaminase/5-amino-6-(5-phosphoribosylamino)uracil reductase RibD [uncultured Helicobacter sp.]|uniref:bifunctional diaminohydroxyphosphoribosylaminopyrimidine deaminase/5-amino-6-(5-phosphoribosylamino)uracil reductase RibD n=1 Tax=uncultured Helicobacter sp. TaxID=175537 RepID=UPI00374F89F2